MRIFLGETTPRAGASAGPRGPLTGLTVLGCTLVSLSAIAQQAPSPSPGPDTTLQEVIVTGSLIKRTDLETPAPVQMISNTEMLQMGYTNVSQVLSSLSAAGQGSLSQSFGEAFAAGAQGIALRGLTVGDTLVLIDGKRMVDYPISDDNQRQFTDISAIPINAVDHIEVLKDGASAIYGADAIAGVVNIILKKSYTGVELSAEGGTSDKHDGTTEHLTALGGIGDLDSNGYNAYIAIDFHHQDQILARNRMGTGFGTLNWSGAGGQNTIPGNDGPNTNAGGYPTYGDPASITGYLLNPTTPNATTGVYPNGLPAESFLPGCNATAQVLNQCEFQWKQLQIQPETEQINVLAKFTKALAGDWKYVATVSMFNSQAEQVCCLYQSTDYAFGGITTTGFGPGVAPHNTSYGTITVPANYPGNPYGAAAPLIYNFYELGMPTTTTDTNTYRVFNELTGSVAGWDVDADIGVMYSRMDESFYNTPEPAALQTALNNGYVIGQGATNAAAVQAGLAPPAYAYPTSALDVGDLTISRKLFDLPGGNVALALGGQFFHKNENLTAPASIVSGVQEGDPYFAIGSQNDAAGFAEVDANVFKQLEIGGAVRYDNYNNGVGGDTTPQFKVKWKPVDMLALRATWGKGFRAPSPAEGLQSGELFGQSGYIVDPVLCPNPSNANARGNFPGLCTFPLTGYQIAGNNLKPVKSTNETFGFVLEPVKQLSVSADYYKIRLTDDIISQSTFGESDYVPGSLVRGPSAPQAYCPPSNPTPVCTPAELVTTLTPVGLPSFASYPYVNAGVIQTEGFDVDLQSRFDLNIAGKLTGEVNYTHIIEYNINDNGTTYDLAGTHGPSEVSGDTGNPKDRLVGTVTWDYSGLSVSATLNYTSHFTITDPSEGIDTCQIALESYASASYGFRYTSSSATPANLCTVHSFVETNFYARYAFDDHLAVHGSINNAFNKQAPIDAQTYGGGGLLAYDGAFMQDGAIGRYFLAGVTYKF